ncbi:hypothetical protein PIROE2DRAFT_12461 [Piromyces sp. E2]|nr:hypothetical protein PIROE2DRAFT_12461 [Piromyces sp. E2]|eukprot:OUM61509.1 hypothetical protein PIROE2DRAFT_12461 [Piromyces sp. E2]
MNNVEFENVNNTVLCDAIYTKAGGNVEFDNVTFKNILYKGAFIRSEDSDIVLNKMIVENYNICNDKDDNKCITKQMKLVNDPETVFLRIEGENEVSIINSSLNNFDLNTMFIYGSNSSISIDNLNIENGHFLNGAIHYAEPNKVGNISIKNSKFKNVKSEKGPVVRIDNLSKTYGTKISFNNVTLQETEATDRGGVVFSTSKYANTILSFDNCKFIDTKARYGSICFAYTIESEPYFSNKNDIMSINSFATNPIKLEIDSNSVKNFTILSGDTIHDNMKCNYH